MKVRFKILFPLVALILLLGSAARTWATPATVWHIPDNGSDLSPTHMRDPWIEISNTPASPTTVTIYEGIQKWTNSGATQIANQTGGTLYYKGASQGTWQSAALGFFVNHQSQNNQYWKAFFSTAGIAANDVIQYYIFVATDGSNGANSGFIYAPAGAGDHGGSTIEGGDIAGSGPKTTAEANPFTIRNRPGWIFHSSNRVNSGSDVQFWAKVGYIGDINTLSTRWATNGTLYYTTDGSDPVPGTTPGTSGSVATQIASFVYDHPDNNGQNGGSQSIAGTAMWWVATGPGLLSTPLGTTIKYKVGFWNPANNEQKFGDYNAGDGGSYLGHVFSFANGTIGDPVLTVNTATTGILNADYTTSHIYVDEVAGTNVPLTIVFSPNAANVVEADVFTNLNRRERATMDANSDGIEDGIIPPDGNLILAGDDTNYYKAYAMTSLGGGQYSYTLNAAKTGAYRLTARYKVTGNPNWIWYSGGSTSRRDHSVVVTPAKARNITMYELNAMNIGSQGTNQSDRSTFTDLYNGPGSRPYDAVTNRFNLTYVNSLGVNWLWFQPIHPIGILNRQTDPSTGQPYAVGSPYSIKNFFQINPLLGKANTRSGALTEFQGFIAAADAAGVNVMLDEPFNHTAWDAELDASGVNYFANGAPATDTISSHEARFYSRSDEYDQRAAGAGNVAQAPDRYDFGKWSDVADVYFGRYAALVPNSGSQGNYTNEGDWFDYSIGSENGAGGGNGHFDSVTQNVWRYFSDSVLYWLDQTGCPQGTAINQTYKGIDGLRADFGQGLPPQCWEYIINKVRTRKWDFVFMTESLDGGAVTYRSNRHFDILNENLIFTLQSAASTSDYRGAFDSRRSSYGQGLVLLNHVSHDEQSYSDPYQALIRHAVCGAVDGAPMIFNGEELGISTNFGFDQYETNFGKLIPQFKKYNSMQPIFAPANRTFGLDQLWPVYAAINQARQFSPALRSSNRYYLNQTGGGGIQQSVFSVAKYESANGSPASSDVVFAFANLDRNNDQQGNFDVNITQNGSNLFGIKSSRTYDVRNIAAYTAFDSNRRNLFLNRKTGSQLLSGGLFVGLKKVPTSDAGWQTIPYEAQYLKLYDVTAPNGTPGAPATPNAYSYSIGSSVTISWAAAPPDSEGVVPCYQVSVTINGNTTSFVTCGTSTVINGTAGQTVTVVIQAVNPSDNSVTGPSSSPTNIKFIDPNGDDDHDGMTNAAEDTAGTNPFDPNSIFKVTSVTSTSVTWTSVPTHKYQLETSGAPGPGGSFTPVGSVQTATQATTSETISVSPPAYYRVRIVP